jgi:SAM-dependent methyltransferase
VARDAGEQGLAPTTDRFGTALSDIVRCDRCGHMQLARMPAEAELREAYGAVGSDDYLGEEAGQRETARRVLARIELHAPGGEGRRLLDLGCWVGFLLDEAGSAGWTATGVEPSAFASRHARERLGLDVRTGDLLTADLPGHAFSAIVLGDVLEHLPRPGRALERIGTLLTPDGVVAMMVPNAGSRTARIMGRRWWSIIPTHVHHFTRTSLTTLLSRHGFAPLELRTQPKALSVAYYLSRIGGYSPPLGRALVRAATAAGLADRVWAPDFRDRMLVIARRG